MIKILNLRYCGAEESIEIDCTGMSKEETEKELVQWVLERVDHWIEDPESGE